MIKVFRLMRPKLKFLAILTILLTIVQVLCFLFSPNLFGSIVALFSQIDSGKDIRINILQNVGFTVPTVKAAIMWIAIIFAAIIFVGAFTSLSAAYLANYVGIMHSRNLRNQIWDHIMHFSKREIEKFTHANLITRFTTDIQRVRHSVTNILRTLITGPINMIFGLVLALLINKNLSLILIFLLFPISIILGIIAKKAIPRFRRETKYYEDISLEAQESILGVRVIKSYNLEAQQENKFQEANVGFSDLIKSNYNMLNIGLSLIFLFANLATTALLATIGFINRGKIATKQEYQDIIREINIFISYIFVMIHGVLSSTMISFNIARGIRSSKKLFEILETSPSIKFIESDKKITNGTIKFDNVSFAYYEKNVIENVSFTLKPGETLGIIGPTGSGKSTIANLINHDYETNIGNVYIDGHNIKEIDTVSLNSAITYIYQIPALISGTIKQNLLLAKQEAAEEELIAATKAACAYDFINNFSKKFEHELETDAANLSGGQKQRLSIAQGLLKMPKILILDDSTSALDLKTESVVKANLKEYFKAYPLTKIIISQKISSIMDADKIIVMHHGKAEAIGTHNELLKTSQLYKEIVAVQLGGQSE
ncbi:ABC transporter ATP-binding protein [Metamycoplasma hyosynoviae]|uniref:ABC transporter ATP-binding protein n=1 Tax=Metamycoplasma hyosynoviae TaxID=29559 RepID=UPI00046206C4|nr:ABC transporter ATP-binding protein [Metamycoplasma hyosynoviae]KDE41498.1 ABC transporter ATP-binding protein [Metamycoplasma hyosynoviae]KDE42753.1 ABC transporter ATP-binding protein [Metamycoplasma hyosynoviae]KDE43177.1 ABC transporter ATP-binding protein [Metamycoplasma hyosynoviae]KDE44753.1 ABC transporter ATP-binding protein [Metamycoplasma hyosynoviae]KDE45383.1 ABC transporter ATP-binding protein [Metamycoplasma hyosynoviae]